MNRVGLKAERNFTETPRLSDVGKYLSAAAEDVRPCTLYDICICLILAWSLNCVATRRSLGKQWNGHTMPMGRANRILLKTESHRARIVTGADTLRKAFHGGQGRS